MDTELDDLPAVVAEFRGLSLRRRTVRLQELIGERSTDPNLLQRRALLVTALREGDLWPHEPVVGA